MKRDPAEPRLSSGDQAQNFPTKTPIKHVVVIFGENISFDHYFGTYPLAANLSGEIPFEAAPETPAPNNLATPLDPTNGFKPLVGVDLREKNPNATAPGNGKHATNPFRLGPEHAWTEDMGHNYKPEQQAAHDGAMDLFPAFVGTPGPWPGAPDGMSQGLVMAFFDGNTVGAFWRYAQEFALNDNSWSTVFGPSTPGAINLISGQTHGFDRMSSDPNTTVWGSLTPDGNGGFTMIGDPQPIGDACSMSTERLSFKGRNIGDLLNAKGVTWGWFQGGFNLLLTNENGSSGCTRSSKQTVTDVTPVDYVVHHQPFQYYASTANPTHARPSSLHAIGYSVADDGSFDPANHQYDSQDFFDALEIGNLPAVSYVKAPAFQDGHAGNSNPIDEQNFVVKVVDAVRASREWSSTAIILAYDDSDGWYDHQAPPIVNPSFGRDDALNGDNVCNRGAQQTGPAPSTPLLGGDGEPVQGRCGYGTRLPLLVLSPFAKKNYIDHTLTDQTSILKFIEDNWLDGERIQLGGSFDTIAGTIENMFAF
ncbi:MAG TPA: alkaline phosphatase family protein [Polyangiaceae bacterium]|nr:alkaline phosphatase family protein [Polyangiaceae bacterium]